MIRWDLAPTKLGRGVRARSTTVEGDWGEPSTPFSTGSPPALNEFSEFLGGVGHGVAVGSRGLQPEVLGADEKRGGLLSQLSSRGREKAPPSGSARFTAVAMGGCPRTLPSGSPAYYDRSHLRKRGPMPLRRGRCVALCLRGGVESAKEGGSLHGLEGKAERGRLLDEP